VLPESSKSNAEETKTEEITSQMESKAREDLRLIKIARELEEMQIFDNKTASLLLFEAM
jgi:exosome complex RNA-binding protein Rrp42 (RNase PH superfamily)